MLTFRLQSSFKFSDLTAVSPSDISADAFENNLSNQSLLVLKSVLIFIAMSIILMIALISICTVRRLSR